MAKGSSKTIKKLVLISTYPLQRCGIATFSEDLLRSIRLLMPEIKIEVWAINKRGIAVPSYPAEVVGQINQDGHADYVRAAKAINRSADETIVLLQHEYGIYGGQDGEYIAELIESLNCQVLTTLHTVVAEPSKHLRRTTARILRASDRVVVLTHDTRDKIQALYPSVKGKIELINHGIHPVNFQPTADAKKRLGLGSGKVLLTFGLLSRNKGIQYVIESLPAIIKKFPDVVYLVVGETHPNILIQEGESYRQELSALVKALKLERSVRFIDNYLTLPQILEYLQATDVYIAPSLDPNQSVSGTLSYALGAGCAVVSSAFSQAREVVNERVGRVVPIADSRAISEAVSGLLARPKQLQDMRREAYVSTRSMLWSNVADNYIHLLRQLARGSGRKIPRWPDNNFSYLKKLTTRDGLLQFAHGDKPDIKSGYTLDDNSRALQTLDRALKMQALEPADAALLAKRYLNILSRCLSQTPPVNYLSGQSLAPTRQNNGEDLRDSYARAYYALSSITGGPLKLDAVAADLMRQLPPDPDDDNVRPVAFYLLAACALQETGHSDQKARIKQLADRLVAMYRRSSAPDWPWFEQSMTYANGQLCASLLEAARLTGSATYRRIGLESLGFLIDICFMGEVYVPIGHDGWFTRGRERALFGQQPEDVLATIQALASAYDLTGDKKYVVLARKAFSWFLGNNLVGLRLFDDKTGGCHDGLWESSVNKNEGAESALAYLQSRLIVERLTRAR